MRAIWRTVMMTILSGLLAGCAGFSSNAAPLDSNPSVLIAMQGALRISRDGWPEQQANPIGVGTVVQPHDLIRAEGRAIFLCADLTTAIVDQPLQRPCPDRSEAILEFEGARFSGVRAPPPPDIPYIIAPRSTLVLDERPLLRWHDTDAPSYQVSLTTAAGTAIWSQEVVGTEIRYPDSQPPLAPNVDYQLQVVDTATNKSSSENVRNLGFQVIPAADRERLQQQIQRLG